MNILHVIDSLEFGGAEKVVVHLANRFTREHRVFVCLTKYRGELVDELDEAVELICLDLGEGLHLRLPGMLAGLILRHDIDIVNIHNWATYVEGWLGVRKAGRACVVLTVHGPYTTYSSSIAGRLKKQLRHFGERVATRSPAVKAVVCVSDAIRYEIRRDIGLIDEKLVTIHNGIEALHTSVTAAGDARLKLITVGRLAAIKNHELLLSAVKQAIEQGARLHLSIVGDGPERAALEALAARLGITEAVDFLGFRSDVGELIAAHDLFVLSSDYEGISIALLESMSLSRPAIATRVGGVPETIHDRQTGLLVEPGDESAYAEAIITLEKDPAWRTELGNNAYRLFTEQFSEDRVIERYQQLYGRCVGA